MHPVLNRIVVNGLTTAAVLGVVGLLLAEVAGMWLAGQAPTRANPVEPGSGSASADPLADALRFRVPLSMAGWGVAFVVVAELVRYWWRGAPKPAAEKVPGDPQPDPAQVLLEQLLAEADAAQAARAAQEDSGVGIRNSGEATVAETRPERSPDPNPDEGEANPRPVGMLTSES